MKQLSISYDSRTIIPFMLMEHLFDEEYLNLEEFEVKAYGVEYEQLTKLFEKMRKLPMIKRVTYIL